MNFTEVAVCDILAGQVITLSRAYVSACEPIRALALLRNVPGFMQQHPAIQARIAQIEKQTTQLASVEAYAAYYGGLGAADTTYGGAFQDENLLTLARCQFVTDHVSVREAKSVMSVGCGDGTFEKALLEKFPHLTMYVSDLNPTGNLAIVALKEMFPGRVFDAPPMGLGPIENPPQVDLVYALEVLEHVIYPQAFVDQLTSCVAPGGACLISVPNPVEWIETYHNVPGREATIQHVRGADAESVRDWFAAVQFSGTLVATGGNILGSFTRQPGPIPVGEPEACMDPKLDLSKMLAQPPLLRRVYVQGDLLFADDARLMSAGGAVFYPLTWIPPGVLRDDG
jgi:2-polyprenyl-3-methyl-5-hydroxy-6-metoxy-1,4-benzoquinol methylase